MQLRRPALLDEWQMTPHALAKAASKRISMSTAYRLAELEGQLQTFDAELLEAHCDIFGVEPGDLLERDPRAKPVRGGR
ncbi:MAG: helix-turn-helix transcriptional regulator [Gemmatimonadaceae bacterium]